MKLRKSKLSSHYAIGKKLIFLIVFLINFQLAKSFSIYSVIDGLIGRTNNAEEIYTNEDEDVTVVIDETEQDILLKEAAKNCLRKPSNNTNACMGIWDSIMCWPETKLNVTVYLPCPNYIYKFNMKNKAFKTCLFNTNSSKPFWSLTNFSLCLKPSDDFLENLEDTTIIEKHIDKIIYIRVFGYTVSMLSLLISIFILLIPKLRCPRNYVHINLFVAITVRTIFLMLFEFILHNDKKSLTMAPSNNTAHLNQSDAEEFYDKIEDKFENIDCKIVNSIYRYSGSVYHVAIFSEALYLVLLLKLPYFSEVKGYKFSILISWTLPILWMVPWILGKIFQDDIWCWQIESNWNYFYKIPHSLLLVANIVCSVIIIRILYSKMRYRNLSREKIIKYRRLAKSILILIPIFGLHFIIFAWIPYADDNINPNIEMITVYIEIFFNACQGLVVSVACCFIHREVHIECFLYACHVLKKIKCLESFKCMSYIDSDHVRQLRFKYNDQRSSSIKMSNSNSNNNLPVRNKSENQLMLIENDVKNNTNDVLNKSSPLSLGKTKKKKKDSSVDINFRKKSTPAISNKKSIKFCCCLFDNDKNDFYQTGRKSVSSISNNRRKSSIKFKSLNFLKIFRKDKLNNINIDSIIEQRLDNNNNTNNQNEIVNLMEIENPVDISLNKTKKVRLKFNDIVFDKISLMDYNIDNLSSYKEERHGSNFSTNEENLKKICVICYKFKFDSNHSANTFTTTTTLTTISTMPTVETFNSINSDLNNLKLIETCDCELKKNLIVTQKLEGKSDN